MKHRLFSAVAVLLAAILLAGCAVDTEPERIERTYAFVELRNMTTMPENYIGKTRTVSGKSASKRFALTDKTYYSVSVSNAKHTDSEEIEYELADGQYPPDGISITVTGEFEVYRENGFPYCRLKDAQITMIEGDTSV